MEVRRIRPGFDPDRKLLLATLLPNRENANISFADLADSLRAVPGVRRVSFIRQPPMGLGGEGTKPVFVAGATQEPLEVAANSAGADYFAIMGTRLLRGRDFSERDVRGTVIVNEVLARRLWGSADAAVGRFLRVGAQDCQVAGVVENGKYHSLVEDPIPYLYTFSRGEGTLVIETAGEPGAMAESVRKAFRESAPDASLVGLVTLREHLRIALFAWQITAGLLGISAVLGVFLAGVGLYGLVSYGVNRRAHEIGVRMAMGASPADVLRLVLRQALAMAGIGAAIGLACAFAAAKVVSALLYRVSPADPLGLLAGIVVVAAVTLLAAQAPARRAIRLDPMAVLRRE